MWLQKLTVFSYSVILLFLIIILYTIVVFSVPSLWSLWLYGFVCIHDTAWPVHFNIASLRQSPIFFAPSRQVCKLLIFRQADIELANAKKQTPLHLAAHAGLHQAAACLLETFQSSAFGLEGHMWALSTSLCSEVKSEINSRILGGFPYCSPARARSRGNTFSGRWTASFSTTSGFGKSRTWEWGGSTANSTDKVSRGTWFDSIRVRDR